MFLKNYTSDVPISETISRIRAVLIRCGVSGITEIYGEVPGKIEALSFTIRLDRPYTIRLFADEKAALDALWLDYADGEKLSADGQTLSYCPRKKKRRRDFAEQAARTAWKLQQDWVEVQMSLIQMKQADFLQVFVAYLWDERKQQSFYKTLQSDGFLALPAPKEQSA